MRTSRFGISTFVNDDSIDTMREGAGRDVPLVTFGTPLDPDYWRTLDELGYGQVNLLLPTEPRGRSLRRLDEYAEKVAEFRGP